MSHSKPGRPKSRGVENASRLTREHWIDAAFQATVERGLDAVRVLALADTLGVTRGSFYWHFSDHAELLQAVIDRWHRRHLAMHKERPSATTEDPAGAILQLLDETIAQSEQDRDHDRFEQALRSRASKDPEVAQLMEQVDRDRLALLHTHYLALTADEQRARELSALFYLAVVGSHQALNRPSGNDKLADYLKSIIARHLVHAVRNAAPGTGAPSGPR